MVDDEIDVDAELSRLAALVDETCSLLEEYGIDYWSQWLRGRAAALRHEGPSGAARFMTGWGGMGGFNDLVISPENGHPIAEADVDRVHRRYEQLREEMVETAQRITAVAPAPSWWRRLIHGDMA